MVSTTMNNDLLDIEDFNGSLEDCNKAIEINPNFKFSYSYRSNTKAMLGDLESALDDLNKAIELDPNYASAYEDRGRTKAMLKDLEGACGDWKKAAELGNEDAAKLVEKYCG